MLLINKARQLAKNQPLAVLATSNNNKPHATLVAHKTNLSKKESFFVTTTRSRKAKNIEKNPQVSLFIDNRKNSYEDFKETIGITLTGRAKITKNKREAFFLQKHPYLKDFVNSQSTSLFRLEIEKIEVVTNFQKVFVVNLDE